MERCEACDGAAVRTIEVDGGPHCHPCAEKEANRVLTDRTSTLGELWRARNVITIVRIWREVDTIDARARVKKGA